MGGARMGRGGVLLSLLAALALGGCADELDPTYLVVKERVVGLEVGVVGADDGRTSAMPGETLSLELRYGAPDGVVEPTWVTAGCIKSACSTAHGTAHGGQNASVEHNTQRAEARGRRTTTKQHPRQPPAYHGER